MKEKDMMDEFMIYLFGGACFGSLIALICICYVCCNGLRKYFVQKLKDLRDLVFFNGLIRSITVAYI